MRSLNDVRSEIKRTRVVTPEIMKDLREIYADLNQITLDQADVLFRIKQLKNIKLPADYKEFFVDILSSFLLQYNRDLPGMGDKEGKWLWGRIVNRDEFDKALLNELKSRLERNDLSLPAYLKKNNYLISKFEDILYNTRYFAIVAVIGAVCSSFILFIQGFGLIIKGLVGFFRDPYEKYEVLFEQLVSSVDVFLFALVLIIFGVGVYELFIANIDPEDKPADKRPTWLKISSVDDLKSSLGKVILMVLIVSFFKHVLEIDTEHWSPISLLYLALGILLIAGALYLTHKSSEGSEGKEKHSESNRSLSDETTEELISELKSNM